MAIGTSWGSQHDLHPNGWKSASCFWLSALELLSIDAKQWISVNKFVNWKHLQSINKFDYQYDQSGMILWPPIVPISPVLAWIERALVGIHTLALKGALTKLQWNQQTQKNIFIETLLKLKPKVTLGFYLESSKLKFALKTSDLEALKSKTTRSHLNKVQENVLIKEFRWKWSPSEKWRPKQTFWVYKLKTSNRLDKN